MIKDADHHQVATITKKVLVLLPKLIIETTTGKSVEIKKDLAIFQPTYTISPQNIVIKGNLLAMEFEIVINQKKSGSVHKKTSSTSNAYAISILEGEDEALIVALAITIAYINSQETTAGRL